MRSRVLSVLKRDYRREFAEFGGLIAYANDFGEQFPQAAADVDRFMSAFWPKADIAFAYSLGGAMPTLFESSQRMNFDFS